MTTRTFFDPLSAEALTHKKLTLERDKTYAPYVYPPPLQLAIRVAQATGRPLLLTGDPGCGKSTVARDVAVCLGYRYVEDVVTSRTAARDLLWRFDHVRRLGDATADRDRAQELRHYLEPGRLWWAFDPVSAARRGASDATGIAAPANPTRGVTDASAGVVLLLDEIDKADPDVPNDLLVPLGEMRFDVDEPPTRVAARRETELIVVITSNGERELPGAFLRRCLTVRVPRPDSRQLRLIARAHSTTASDALIEQLILRLAHFAEQAKGARKPGTAEFLDAMKACEEHAIDGDTHALWDDVTRLTMWKVVEES